MSVNIEKLVEEFAKAIIKQNEAIMKGNYKLGNKYAKKYIKCYQQLFKVGEEGKEALAKLFNHDDIGVREMAAVVLLKYKTEEALKILRELANKPGLIGFGASEAIKRWEEGTWNLE